MNKRITFAAGALSLLLQLIPGVSFGAPESKTSIPNDNVGEVPQNDPCALANKYKEAGERLISDAELLSMRAEEQKQKIRPPARYKPMVVVRSPQGIERLGIGTHIFKAHSNDPTGSNPNSKREGCSCRFAPPGNDSLKVVNSGERMWAWVESTSILRQDAKDGVPPALYLGRNGRLNLIYGPAWDSVNFFYDGSAGPIDMGAVPMWDYNPNKKGSRDSQLVSMHKSDEIHWIELNSAGIMSSRLENIETISNSGFPFETPTNSGGNATDNWLHNLSNVQNHIREARALRDSGGLASGAYPNGVAVDPVKLAFLRKMAAFGDVFNYARVRVNNVRAGHGDDYYYVTVFLTKSVGTVRPFGVCM
jgi:hypothetical protein